MKNEKIALVTGASGFIGKHLCQRLLKDGWTVHAIVRYTTNVNELIKLLDGKITCHYYDAMDNHLVKIIGEVQPTAVFHLASLFLVNHQFEDIVPMVSSNIILATQLVDAMIQNGVYHLVNTGTSWQHYQNNIYNPVNLYAATKQAFLDIVKYYQEISPLKVITLTLFDTYGPGDSRQKLFQLLNKVAQTKEVLQMSPGQQLVDFVYIDDVIDAFCQAANLLNNDTNDYSGEYAVSSLEALPLRDMVKVYEDVFGEKLNIAWGERPYRQREVMTLWSNGKVLPGWTPKFNLKRGIDRTLNGS